MGNILTKTTNVSDTTEYSTDTIKPKSLYISECNCKNNGNGNVRTEQRQNREILRELKSIKINLKYLNKKIGRNDYEPYFNKEINYSDVITETNAALNEKYSW